jgi:YggT family protein
MAIIGLIINWFILLMLLWIVLSYIVAFGKVGWDHPVRKIYDALSKIIDPVLRPIRAVVPPVRIGGSSLDLSPLILILGLSLLESLLRRITS